MNQENKNGTYHVQVQVKEPYEAPRVEVIKMEGEGVIAGSFQGEGSKQQPWG